jgi:hypothetical protein
VDIIDASAERQKRGNDGTGTGPEYQVEALVEGAPDHTFDFPERPERIEALRPAAIERQDAEQFFLFGRSMALDETDNDDNEEAT